MQLEGKITDIRFQSAETGYCVATLETDDGEITIVGTFPEVRIGESVTATGELVFHAKYGGQFKASAVSIQRPTSKHAIYSYLASGIIDKIGPKTAEAIVDLFGEETLRIMQDTPERLLQVRGIGKKTLARIVASYKEQEEGREVMLYLQGLGLTSNLSYRIYKEYGDRTRQILTQNPYQLTLDIEGIGFRKADEIARLGELQPDDPARLKAGLLYLLQEAEQNGGHCCLPEPRLLREAAELLQVEEPLIAEALFSLRLDGKLHHEEVDGVFYAYRMEAFEAERDIAFALARKLQVKAADIPVDRAWVEGLGEEQQQGIDIVTASGVSIITGGPGTGKTTLLRALLGILQADGQHALLCAPTGRAAKRMEESTGTPAATIHRMLGYNPTAFPPYEFDEDNPLDADWIIVDESSMLDVFLMERLLRAVKVGTRLVFVGDVDQLPSVGAGNVLKDLIDSDVIPKMRLTQIYRQAQESAIVTNAHRMQNGDLPVVNENGTDFFFMKTSSQERTVGLIAQLLASRLPKAYQVNPIGDIQVLTPVKKQPTGTVALNASLQEALNPYTPAKGQIEVRGVWYREGDRVMQMRNNYDIAVNDATGELRAGVYNGDLGIVDSVFDDGLVVRFDDDSTCIYRKKEMDDLQHAYAITIHKSQGSEFPIVVIPLHWGPMMLYTRNLLYTAITRAKQLVVLVGEEEVMRKMIANTHQDTRYTHLRHRLQQAYQTLQRGISDASE